MRAAKDRATHAASAAKDRATHAASAAKDRATHVASAAAKDAATAVTNQKQKLLQNKQIQNVQQQMDTQLLKYKSKWRRMITGSEHTKVRLHLKQPKVTCRSQSIACDFWIK